MPIQTRRRCLVLLSLVAATSLSALAAELNLSGTWSATVHVPQASSGTATLVLEQNGESLSGKITNAYGRESEVTGKIVGTQIQLSYASSSVRVRTDAGDKPLVLNFEGSVNDGEIDATAKISFGEATLKAKRK
ncbi:MAG TPA: hypothetical protein VK629_02350 [Steroidobacteraceae bacterium]|nr:hypothetical protein [Steroidobacteraceae bacterium]